MGNRLTKLILIIVFLSSFVSCAEIRYKSSGKVPVKFTKSGFHKNFYSMTADRTFFLWGLVPGDYVIEIDDELQKRRITELSGMKIKEQATTFNLFITLITLGLVVPKKIEIEGYTL